MPVHDKFDIEAILESMDAIEFGAVHRFSRDEGFGFITPESAERRSGDEPRPSTCCESGRI